jgi:septum formation protein
MSGRLWRGAAPPVLASTSATRRMLLESAGLDVEVRAPDIDERSIDAATQGAFATAFHLAREKALAVSRSLPDRVVIGADQTLACEGALFHKPATPAAARAQLAALSGRTHILHSAFAVARDGAIVRDGIEEVRMTMRPLSAEMIGRYLALAGDAALLSVGAYQAEGLGIHLFERIEGDHSTILGLPMIPLLAALRAMDLVDL